MKGGFKSGKKKKHRHMIDHSSQVLKIYEGNTKLASSAWERKGSCIPSQMSSPEAAEQDLEHCSFKFEGPLIHFDIKAGKVVHPVEFGADNTGRELKQYIEAATGLPAANQKILFKGFPTLFVHSLCYFVISPGQLKDDLTLAQSGVTDGSKVSQQLSSPLYHVCPAYVHRILSARNIES